VLVPKHSQLMTGKIQLLQSTKSENDAIAGYYRKQLFSAASFVSTVFFLITFLIHFMMLHVC
jgi:hypothetical protein